MLPRVSTEPTTGAPELPARQLRDPKALRAIAHPVRVRMLEELTIGGPATATELAERVGESPANCSWHLRQLARYGFVEEAGGGTGRQRPWQIVVRRNVWDGGGQDAEAALAGDAAADVLFAREYEEIRAWWARARSDDPEWWDAPFVTRSIGWLTAEELAELGKEIVPILNRYTHRVADPKRRPPGSRPVRFVAWGYPAQSSQVPVPPNAQDEEIQ